MKTQRQQNRQRRVRLSLRENSDLPRLSVYRSNQHIWAQLIDDKKGHTLASANDTKLKGNKSERAALVGTSLAKLALKAGVKQVVFDRGAYRYHGRVKALAEAAKQAGLKL